MRTTHKFAYADFDVKEEDAYVKVSNAFRFYRKYDKLNQYLEGQLVKDDDKLIGVGTDGVPELSRLTMDEKLSSAEGDSVKMFPRYEIMQKFTKRNSSGVHTIPSRNQTKGVIDAPKDSLLVYTDISGMELRGIAGISRDAVMIDYFESGKDIYSEAAAAYYNGILNKGMDMGEVRKLYRNPFKLGVISTIYTAGDPTLAEAFDCQLHEVRFIKQAIFTQFQQLYEWQQSQIEWNKANRGFIKTFLGDIRRTNEEYSKQTRQSINADVQGTCSLIATTGFNNIIVQAHKKKMRLEPAVLVHDALIAYAKAWDVELLYDHYQEHFYKYLDDNYQFRFPFDLELATTYYDKIVLSKDKSGKPRHYNVSGTNISVHQVLSRVLEYGKKIEFLDPEVNIDVIKERIDNKYDIYEQYTKTNGNASYDRDFSFGSYDIVFVD